MVKKIIPLLVILISLLLRFGQLDKPLTDIHSWKQTDTYSVAKKYYENKTDFLNEASYFKCGKTTNCRYTGSFPLYEYLLGKVFGIFGESVFVARFFSAAIFALSSYFLYLLTRDLLGYKVGLATVIIYNVLPFSIYWGRAVIPDGLSILLSNAGLYLFTRRRNAGLIAASVVLGLSALIKPYFAIILLPVVYFLRSDRNHKQIVTVLITVISFMVAWNLYLANLPDSIQYPYSTFGLNHRARSLFFDGGNFLTYASESNWPLLIFQRIVDQLTPLGIVLLIAGIFTYKQNALFIVWLVSAMIPIIVISRGNLAHEYYQFIYIPPAAVLIGNYLVRLSHELKKINFGTILIGLFVVICFGILPFVNNLKQRTQPELRYIEFMPDVRILRTIIAENESVILVGDESPSLFNYLGRDGWIINFNKCIGQKKELIRLISKHKNDGAKYIVIQKKSFYYKIEGSYYECISLLEEILNPAAPKFVGKQMILQKL
jgi:hypothetical protein